MSGFFDGIKFICWRREDSLDEAIVGPADSGAFDLRVLAQAEVQAVVILGAEAAVQLILILCRPLGQGCLGAVAKLMHLYERRIVGGRCMGGEQNPPGDSPTFQTVKVLAQWRARSGNSERWSLRGRRGSAAKGLPERPRRPEGPVATLRQLLSQSQPSADHTPLQPERRLQERYALRTQAVCRPNREPQR